MIENLEQLRAAFEKWASGDGQYPEAIERRDKGHYVLMQVNQQWIGWVGCYSIMKGQS